MVLAYDLLLIAYSLPTKDRFKMGLNRYITYCFYVIFILSAISPVNAKESGQSILPMVSSRVGPASYQKILNDREIVVHAKLKDQRDYSFYAVMLVHASRELTRQTLTNYPLYAKMIPYVQKSLYTPETHSLDLMGGIWMFELHSIVVFDSQDEKSIHFHIVSGHFTGLKGEMHFESLGERGTLVTIEGAVSGTHWPPTFVIERGAEVVFGFTGNRMRNFIETPEGVQNDPQVPRPKSHL